MIYKYLIENEKIIRGPSDDSITYKAGENQEIKEIEVDKNNPPNWTINENGKLKGFHPKDMQKWDNTLNHPILKSENELKIEKLKTIQGKVLNKLTPVNLAISAQDATNKIKVKKGKAEVFAISDDDVEAVGDYQNIVANFHNTWNPDDYTLEQIDETVFNGGLNIPDIINRYL
jgi:hypothetical protein